MSVTLGFDQGTLLVDGGAGSAELDEPVASVLRQLGFQADPRAGGRLRGQAISYRRALAVLIRAGLSVNDEARRYTQLELAPEGARTPYPHQAGALAAWRQQSRRGTVVLPTGSGKSYVAELAIRVTGRSTLIVAPTIDLMNQWVANLGRAFAGPEGDFPVGSVGGGDYDVRDITVTTYDSAYLHMPRFGDRFGLVVFDECHHLPGASYSQAAECSIAPFRLGLTATPERSDGGHERLDRLIGPIIFRREIKDLQGRFLAPYQTERVRVHLSDAEREAYERERALYRSFVNQKGIRMSRPDGWGQFIMLSSRSPVGRRAFRAWREQRRIALQCESKLDALAKLLASHGRDPTIVFTADNDTVYRISRRHLMPAITHQTPAKERRATLAAFESGAIRAIVTSRVLNEGVDLPAAQVGVVLSGSSSVREHVQRLGRILRKKEGKQAILYELVTVETGEERSSERRREHGAYR